MAAPPKLQLSNGDIKTQESGITLGDIQVNCPGAYLEEGDRQYRRSIFALQDGHTYLLKEGSGKDKDKGEKDLLHLLTASTRPLKRLRTLFESHMKNVFTYPSPARKVFDFPFHQLQHVTHLSSALQITQPKHYHFIGNIPVRHQELNQAHSVVWWSIVPDISSASPAVQQNILTSPYLNCNSRYGTIRYIIEWRHFLQLIPDWKLYCVGTNVYTGKKNTPGEHSHRYLLTPNIYPLLSSYFDGKGPLLFTEVGPTLQLREILQEKKKQWEQVEIAVELPTCNYIDISLLQISLDFVPHDTICIPSLYSTKICNFTLKKQSLTAAIYCIVLLERKCLPLLSISTPTLEYMKSSLQLHIRTPEFLAILAKYSPRLAAEIHIDKWLMAVFKLNKI